MKKEQYRFFNRDISWLSFNKRVLDEATSDELPLYEKINFLAIYSNNLDEFFKVRIASYKKLLSLPKKMLANISVNPEKILKEITVTVNEQMTLFNSLFNDVFEKLKEHNIYLVRNLSRLNDEQKAYVEDLFFNTIVPHTHPMLLLKNRVNPFLQNDIPYFLLRMHRRSVVKNPQFRYAIVHIPCHYFDRFIEIPQRDDKYYIMFLDDIVRMHLDVLFPGYKIDKLYSFLVARDADVIIEDEFDGDDLVGSIEKSLSKRAVGEYSRFIYDSQMPKRMVEVLKSNFKLTNSDMIEGGKYLKMNDLFAFPNPLSPELEREKIAPLQVKELNEASSILEAVKKKEFLLHFPYDSYDYVIRMLNEAAVDEKVEKIMVTQYRVAKNSAVVHALKRAAANGKKVTVFVEVKARFDEEANLRFAKEMERSGINIIYSIPKIKVHAKVALILREGEHTDYAFLSTGNFNEKTATLYSDLGFFTARKAIIKDMINLFEYLENQQTSPRFKYLFIGQFNMYKNIMKLIDQEIQNKKDGKEAYMILKMNGLQEMNVIRKLYEASSVGVKVDLIVRGICCLVPNQEYSKNIRVVRIVDRFLEHARVYYFHNGGKDLYYLSSADLMNRNMHRRIESVFPIEDKKLKTEVRAFLDLQLADNQAACLIDENLNNVKINPKKGEKKVRVQEAMFEYLRKLDK